MATTDFSQVPDDQMEHIFGLLENSANFIPNEVERRAFVAEYFRRRRGAKPPATGGVAPNVASNLAASATPIAVEPVAGSGLRPPPSQAQIDEALIYGNVQANGQPAGSGGGLGIRNTPEDLAVYAAVVGDANRRETERMRGRVDARLAGGYRDPRQEAYNAETGVMPASAPLGDTVMVDGVEVPVRMRDGAGRPMTTIGDERRAMEAAAEAQIVDRVSREAQEDLQRYGDGSLQFYRYDPQSAENGVLNVEEVSPSERDARFQQIHGRAPTQAERAAYEQQAANLAQRRGMEERQTDQNRMLRQRAAGNVDRQQAWSRDFIRARNMLAGGAQNINSGNVGAWNRLAMLGPKDRMDVAFPQLASLRAEVEKVNLERAAALAARGIQGALAGSGGTPLDAARAQIALDQAGVQREESRQPSEDVLGDKYAPDRWGPQFVSGYDEFTIEEQQQMYDDLIARGYKPAEAQAAVDRQAVKRRATDKMDWDG